MDRERFVQYMQETQKLIEENGFTFQAVYGDEERPPWIYTIGLTQTYKHPELFVIGPTMDVSELLLTPLVNEVRNGKRFVDGERSGAAIEGFDVAFHAVAKENYDNYFGIAQSYYRGEDFDVLQVVWPDNENHFPWEEGFDEELRLAQPLP
ncbi:MAG: DUF4262 domain-containing protein [Chloroflexota bacterium]|nr:DUF4262 domain-containing protein [Chloroflexota bacterium]